MVKAAVYMMAFYIVYSVLLSRDTAYSRNRAYILLSILSSFILPFVSLHTLKPMNIRFFGKLLSDVFITPSSATSAAAGKLSSTESILNSVFTIYLIVACVFFIKVLIDLLNLLFLILRHKDTGSRIIRFSGFSTSGFSAMGYIFINVRLSPEDAGEIIRHEQNHLRLNHFLDIIFIEIIKSFQWFNPVAYLFNRSLRAIHEYQADERCISSGVPIVSYQSLLLSQVFKSRAFNMSNSFSNPSLIKKRMIMMTKARTSSIANIKILLVIPVAAFVFLTISAYREIPSIDGAVQNGVNLNTRDAVYSKEEPFVAVEEMPMFPGGDEALLKYIGENTTYPENSKMKGVQGRVIVRFCVTSTGSVDRLTVLHGVAADLDAEALRVVGTLPKFKPGRQSGKDVPVWYMVPITFTLK
jgi:TonB family protein